MGGGLGLCFERFIEVIISKHGNPPVTEPPALARPSDPLQTGDRRRAARSGNAANEESTAEAVLSVSASASKSLAVALHAKITALRQAQGDTSPVTLSDKSLVTVSDKSLVT